jgi:DNA-binding MarR family transcriptional regulator
MPLPDDVTQTCALDGCDNTFEYSGKGRPAEFCSKEHARYYRNHKPEAVAGRKAYGRRRTVNREKARINEQRYRERKREERVKITKTCALDGCDNTWQYDGTRRKYCSPKHRVDANENPEAIRKRRASTKAWRQRNPGRVKDYQIAYREKRRKEREARGVADRLTGVSLRVMLAIIDTPEDAPLYVRLIALRLGKQPADVVPVVNRLIEKGWAVDEREEDQEDFSGETVARGTRRYIRPTAAGRARLDRVRLSEI